ncbi:sigma-70 family RNA polymerase sigma factor [Bacillus massilinigeriensis]|uniref:sigma-70 family RNA polymerase sigma factor n=1 Tax=Bacillus mediterraneensis TaxID=1805474 RepID=UPI000AC90807|nr:sigma-70 family RNA polymerase sigma factor [Bacillus mediterraneensis]
MIINQQRLIKKAIKGNKSAFEKLVRQHYEQIYRTAYLYVHNEEDALDVVQEASYQAFQSIRALKHPEFFTTWLTKIVIRCAGQVLKKNSKLVVMSDDMILNLSQPLTENERDSGELLSAIQQLRGSYRTAIIYFYYYDYSIKTISTLMEVPEGTVKTYLSRGKAELKKFYEEMEGECHG